MRASQFVPKVRVFDEVKIQQLARFTMSVAQFNIGDKAVYPSYGVVLISRIESKEIAGSTQDFYVMKILSTGADVLVPTSSGSKVMRKVMSNIDVESVYSILSKPVEIPKITWSRRVRLYGEKLRSGSVEDIASVLRDLSSIRNEKSLSYSEKEMFERARDMIVSEICAACSQTTIDIEKKVDSLLGDTQLH